MCVDYSLEAIRQAEEYARLPEVPGGDTLTPSNTISHWYFDIKPTNSGTLPLFIQTRDPIAQAAGLDPDDFLDIVWCCPRLMRRKGISSWPRSLLLGNQKPPVLYPTQTILFIKLVSTFASDWKKTVETGQPHNTRLTQCRPGYVHIRDVVIYRLVKQALLESGLNMRMLPDPNEVQQLSTGFPPPPPDTELRYCAKHACMVLGMHPMKCSGCLVAYYCSEECSKADWTAQHHYECSNLQVEQINAGLRLSQPSGLKDTVEKEEAKDKKEIGKKR